MCRSNNKLINLKNKNKIIEKMNNYDYLLKFILIGDSTVGKTCILTRFVDGWFKAESDPTIGVEFGSKVLKCKSGITVRL